MPTSFAILCAKEDTMNEPIRVLSHEDMQRIHEAALSILERTGMRIDHPEALRLLRKFGCRVDEGSMLVQFPKQRVQESVDRMRTAYANPDRMPTRMGHRYSHIRFRTEPHRIYPDFTVNTGGFCCFIHDLDGRRRRATLDDVQRSIHLVNQLEHIDHTGLPVSDQDTLYPLRPVAMAAELAKRTTKFGGVETFKKEDIPYLIEIGAIVKGSLDALRAEPILVGYGEARSPLCFDRNMADIFMEYIRRGFPQTVDTMPNAGATAPMTQAGTLALGIAETLGPVVLAHAIDENAVVGVDIIPSACDMQSGLYRYSSAERWPMLAARVQLISEFYGCPSGVHGLKTDGCFQEEQVGFDKAMSLVYPVLAGAVGVGTAGHLENALTFSPAQLVIDNEFAGAMHWALRPIEVNDETLALDVIDHVGPGGEFLTDTHTAEHFRDVLHLSNLFDHCSWDSAHARTPAGFTARSEARARELWAEEPPVIVDPSTARAIDEVVEHARRALIENQP